jgi:two-component system NtrC family response regulator
VRELEASLERAVHALGPGGTITASSLGEFWSPSPPALVREGAEHLKSRTRELEVELIARAIARAGGNRSRAARDLGLSRQGLWKKLRRFGREEAAARAADAEPPHARAPRAGLLPESP